MTAIIAAPLCAASYVPLGVEAQGFCVIR